MKVNDTVQVITFGCRLNAHESQTMHNLATQAGLRDTILVNTCAVTAEAERQARQAIRRLRRENPGATIVVSGCAAQIKPERYAAMAEVNHVWPNDAKMAPATYHALRGNLPMPAPPAPVHPIPAPHPAIPRAFLAIQNGCDHRCTFCIIPYGRGPSRSIPIGEVVEKLSQLVQAGYHEVVFTGVDITSYGNDLPGQPSLGQMVRRVLALVPGLPRLRLSSLDPAAIDEDLWRVIAEEPRLMPHLHLSLQAGDDMVLKRMKRRHRRDDAIALIARARLYRPDIAFGADIIAGFPTESEAMFQNTLALVEEHAIAWLHVFPYSAREGTPAAKMPQLPMPVRAARAAQLRAAGAATSLQLLQQQCGQVQEVLVESNKEGIALGRTPHYAGVAFTSPHPAGSLVMVEMLHPENGRLTGVATALKKAA